MLSAHDDDAGAPVEQVESDVHPRWGAAGADHGRGSDVGGVEFLHEC